ncbi:ATP synthase subunit g, mitochondrial-like [Neocloeon triangulifer]|uniref:ATP synthase subunit g, mitochondrial-like n=1 Tax=Neocloeon triangulifer TaxID=2078957 RepID=UPI00286F288A|nr:ATP synthase subunit g, mitochondrial-like [Neocloeon triangulifer]
MASKAPALLKGVLDGAQPKFQTFLRYAKVELVPPTPGELGQVGQGIQRLLSGLRTGRWKQLTVKEATLNTLVFTEVVCWFFIGECIGKGSIVGYQV